MRVNQAVPFLFLFAGLFCGFPQAAHAQSFISRLNGMCVSGDGSTPAAGKAVIMWGCGNVVAQKAERTNTNEIKIGGFCFDANGGTVRGASVTLWTCHGGYNQKFALGNDGYIRQGNQCLAINGGNAAQGSKLILWDCVNHPSQLWNYQAGGQPPAPIAPPTPVKPPPPPPPPVQQPLAVPSNAPMPSYRFSNANSSSGPFVIAASQPFSQGSGFPVANLCLDVGSFDANTNVVAFNCHGGDSQMFNLEEPGRIVMNNNPKGAMCLDGGKNRAGQPVYIAPCNNSPAQSWYTTTIPGVLRNRTVDGEWKPRSSLGQIQNRANGLCIDIDGARTDLSRGNNVVLYGCQPIYIDPNPSWAMRNKERPWNQVWGAGHVMNSGAAYIFQRNNPPVVAGHVGWGVQLADGQWLGGAVDGTLGAVVNKGENNHTFKRLFRTEAELREFFLHGDDTHPFQPYDRYMRWGVGKANTAAVYSLEAQSGDWGYGVFGNNCMDQAYKILKVYGLNLQSPAETKHTFPVDWFNAILGGTQPFLLRR